MIRKGILMLKSIMYIWKEHKNNGQLILKLAFMNMERQTIRSSLGILWTYFHDLVYILVFVMFRLLIAGSADIMGINNVVYLTTGIIPWFFINDVLNQGTMAIRNNKGIVQSIRFSVSILPTIEVLTIFFKRIFSFIMLFVIVIAFGYIEYFHFYLFVYYMICALALCISLNLLLSAFIAISDDFRQLYFAFARVLIYTMPILWDFSKVNSVWINVLLRVNPMVYVVKGFRDAFVLGHTQDGLYTAYFWGCVVVMFILGSVVQYKLGKYYADFV